MQEKIRALVIGIGNPGRGDDGLGPALVERLRAESMDIAALAVRHQLNIEDADLIKDFDLVVFADAASSVEDPISLSPVEPAATITFSTHEMAPSSVLALCQDLFNHTPRAFLLAIRGQDWSLKEAFSEEAERNLGLALRVLKDFLNRPAP